MTTNAEGRTWAEKSVLVSFAGPIAERRAARCAEPGRYRRILSSEQARAHHEAGHAVVSIALGWGTYELSIEPELDVRVGAKGYLGGYASTGPSMVVPDREKWRRDGLDSDLQSAVKLSVLLAPAVGWRATLRTAKTLRARAAALLNEHWHLVRYLAAELETRRKMDQQEIERAILNARAAERIRRRVGNV